MAQQPQYGGWQPQGQKKTRGLAIVMILLLVVVLIAFYILFSPILKAMSFKDSAQPFAVPSGVPAATYVATDRVDYLPLPYGVGGLGQVIEPGKEYVDTENWKFLANVNALALPGGRVTAASGKDCAIGFLATDQSQKKSYAIIPGHCANLGEKTYVHLTDGSPVSLGPVVAREYVPGVVDYALVELSSGQSSFHSGMPMDATCFDTTTPMLIAQSAAPVCHLSYDSGLRCGTPGEAIGQYMYSATARGVRGSLGGPVFTVRGQGIEPVGFAVGNDPLNGNKYFVQLAAPILEQHKLILGSMTMDSLEDAKSTLGDLLP